MWYKSFYDNNFVLVYPVLNETTQAILIFSWWKAIQRYKDKDDFLLDLMEISS